MSEVKQEQGNLSINSENLFPIIKKWLYSDHDIFYRELISNGCDAITKLKKLDAEYNKIAAKISELQVRQKEVEKQRTELKNNDILELVHEHHLDYAALSALIQKLDISRPVVMAGEMEDTTHE